MLKHAVGMEIKGLRMSRGPVVWKQVAKEFNIKGGRNTVYDWLTARVEELKPQQEHQIVEGGRLVREVGGQEVN